MKKFIMLLFIILILVPLHGNKTELTEILSDLEQGIKQLQKKEYKPAPGMNVMAESLGTLEKIFEFVRDEIRFEGYAGKLRGPLGT
ncbi:MAG: hypothetical protein KAX11_08885, partial [Candidatus Aminicenantes bacterium]|nr:hypothetical protein [Candidatus Aminicenantes bacterium]